MNESTYRTELLLGKEGIEKLKNAHVAVFGIGGVGSFAVEAIARAGVGKISIIDKDIVDITNINRQLLADFTTIGLIKTDVMKKRILTINPHCIVNDYNLFFNEESYSIFFENQSYDYIIDAIDTVASKIFLINSAYKNNIPIISSMGMGNKLQPTMIEVANIHKTSVCPLARIIRKEAKEKRIKKLKVVYSKEIPIKINNPSKTKLVGSVSFVPSCAGLIIAGEVIKDIVNKKTVSN